MRNRPLLIFDGRCDFCAIWIRYWQAITGDRIDYAASQDVGPQFPHIPPEEFSRSVQLIQPDGSVLSGAAAVCETLRYSPGHRWLVALYRFIPGLAALSAAAYRFLARRRNLFYRATVLAFGREIQPARYVAIEWLFLRALALVYLIAFLSLGAQITGLIGSRGILPAAAYLAAVRQSAGPSAYWFAPTLLWFNSSDTALGLTWMAGAAFSLALLAGFARRICLAALFVLYLSLCSVGQDFLSFQWDMLLLEAGFLAFFLGLSPLVIWLFRWLLFRLMFLSGAVKLLSHDPAWRHLDALRFHYWTQPLPTPLAWYMSQAPVSFQRASTAVVLLVELLVPWLIFLPRRLRLTAVPLLAGLQVLIFATGNYTFFNLLTLALCLFVLDDRALPLLPRALAARAPAISRSAIVAPVALLIVSLSAIQLSATFFGQGSNSSLLRLAAPFGIVNSYGLFAVMTTTRPEIQVQGSRDGVAWLDYGFPDKPGDLSRAPRYVAPYQPRLDWQMWFAALSDWRSNPWFADFMLRLLEGSPPVLALLDRNPFPQEPPRYVRALLYQYRFTTAEERARTGHWWEREPAGTFFPAVSKEAFTVPKP